jgi:uncharacterized protein YegL
MPERPGGTLAKRPLQFVWLVDCSGSMAGTKIETVNSAIRESIKPMQDVADQNPNVEVQMRVITFATGAQWHLSQPTEVHQFLWADVDAGGTTDMGQALSLVADALRIENMPQRGLPPVLVMISDGQPTDDFNRGLKALLDQPWGQRAVRIAVAIGDADLDVLKKFIGNNETPPLVADNAADLTNKIKWASTVPLKAVSNPASRTVGMVTGGVSVPMPPPPGPIPPGVPGDVF